jgi:MFS transporter, PAT family, solute carrier family 33 (acetyl-CoA transportor), member 1
MPDSISEPITFPLSIRRPSVEAAHQSFQSHTLPVSDQPPTHDIELAAIVPSSSQQQSTTDLNESSTFDSDTDSDSQTSNADLLSSPMRRTRSSTRKSRSPNPNLTVKTNGHIDGEHLNGHANGHANGTMNGNIELRRKNAASTDDLHKEQVMRHSSFSLDNEPPPPPTPQTPGMVVNSFSSLPPADKRNFLLLVVLYFLQGIPMGLAYGSVPFLLKNYLSYGQIGIFSLSIYPFSLKLLWSPIVDAIWSKRIGRRKSWILPIQTISGLSLIYLGGHIDNMMIEAGKDSGSGVWNFTGWWFMLVFLSATQDIAVDGWAISLLSIQNIAYASTAQTVGITAGSFLSHTVFLALQAPDFANHWFRTVPQDVGILTLGGYMTFWGWFYLIVTAGLAFFKRENKDANKEGIMEVYRSMWAVLKLPNIITIVIIHLIAKLGFVTAESVTNLKLLDKGFGQANLALVVLIDFPFELSLGYYAGKWSTKYTPLRLWCWAYVFRLIAAGLSQLVVMIYPTAHDEAVPTWYLLTVIVGHVYYTFTGTVMFVAICAFHARIADPAIGGTYMTLLAT